MSAPQDLAAAAFDRAGDLADRATDLASAALERFEDLPDQARSLAGTAIPALRPPKPRSRTPWLLIALLAAVLVGGFWVRRRRAAPDGVSGQHDHSERSIAAAS